MHVWYLELEPFSQFACLLLLFCFTVSGTEGLTATCAAAFGFFLTYQTGNEDLRPSKQ